jgi:hypothetical protein
VRNIILKGDKCSDEHPIEITRDEFVSPNDGGFFASFYENNCTNRGVDIPMMYNKDAAGEDDSCIPLDNLYTMTYLGNLQFDDNRIRTGDQIKVTIIASPSGSSAIVEHVPTGISKPLKFINKHTKTDEEIEEKRIETMGTKIALD